MLSDELDPPREYASCAAANLQASARLARLTRLYEVVNSAMEAIVRTSSPLLLCQGVCDASVLSSKFRATTIFMASQGDKRLTSVASNGPYASWSVGAHISMDENLPEGRGMIGTAFRTGRPAISNDILRDERLRPWWDIGRKTGFNAVAALPLLQSGRAVGVLTYYSCDVGEFDAEMVGLLERVAGSISFALDNFERTAQRDRAETATVRASRMYAALSATNEAIMRVKTPQELFAAVCAAGVEAGDFIGAEVLVPDDTGLRLAAATSNGRALQGFAPLSVGEDGSSPLAFGYVEDALRTQATWACNEFLADVSMQAWHHAARLAGIESMAAVPFSEQGRPAGVLLCYSAEKGAFDAGVVSLLERLAANLAFALDNFQREAERARSQERIEFLATHDTLTGLPNRLMFAELLAATLKLARRKQRGFAVLLIDLDRFKSINDTLGHQAGDALLCEIALRFRQTLRASDLVARLGGDEFIVLLSEVSGEEEIKAVGRKLLAAAAEPVMVSGHECCVSASIGAAVYPDDGEDADLLIKCADAAMYMVKQKGTNHLQFFRRGHQ